MFTTSSRCLGLPPPPVPSGLSRSGSPGQGASRLRAHLRLEARALGGWRGPQRPPGGCRESFWTWRKSSREFVCQTTTGTCLECFIFRRNVGGEPFDLRNRKVYMLMDLWVNHGECGIPNEVKGIGHNERRRLGRDWRVSEKCRDVPCES